MPHVKSTYLRKSTYLTLGIHKFPGIVPSPSGAGAADTKKQIADDSETVSNKIRISIFLYFTIITLEMT